LLELDANTVERLESGRRHSCQSSEILGMDLSEAWEQRKLDKKNAGADYMASDVSPIDSELYAAIKGGMNPSDFYDFACALLKII
jgi:hypothetical protein